MAQIPKRIPVSLAGRIEHFDDERGDGNGYIVTLCHGWTIDPGIHCGVFGADTVREVREILERATPCGCNECGTRTMSVSHPPAR